MIFFIKTSVANPQVPKHLFGALPVFNEFYGYDWDLSKENLFNFFRHAALTDISGSRLKTLVLNH